VGQVEGHVVVGLFDGVPVRQVGLDRTRARSPRKHVLDSKPDAGVVFTKGDPVEQPYDHVTLDLSHAATSGSDALAMAAALGPRLVHVHLADGLGSSMDEHLVPGRGGQPCAELLEALAVKGFSGSVVVEVSTRRVSEEQREVDLAEALAFARLHLATAAVRLT